MGYGGYGYGGYGGYGGYPGYGFPGYSYPGMGGVGNTQSASQSSEGHGNENGENGHDQKSSGVGGFFKGIANGAVNLVKGIFTPQGIIMLAGTVALTWATGGAILPLLGAIGMGTGGYQMLKGAADGNAEKVGEGFFNFGLSALGFAGPKAIKVGETEYGMVGTGKKGEVSLLDRLKAPFGFTKYQAADADEALNLYELSWRKMQSRFDKTQGGASGTTGQAQGTRQLKNTQTATRYRPLDTVMKSLEKTEEKAHKLYKELQGIADRYNKSGVSEKDKLALNRQFQDGQAKLDAIMADREALIAEAHMRTPSQKLGTMGQNAKSRTQQAGHGVKGWWNRMWGRDAAANAEQIKANAMREKRVNLAEYNASRSTTGYRDIDLDWDPSKKPTRYVLADEGSELDITEGLDEDLEETTTTDHLTDELADAVEHKQTLMGDLEHLFSTKNLTGDLKTQKAEFDKLVAEFPDHAGRLHDIWNLKILELVDSEKNPAYLEHYRAGGRVNLVDLYKTDRGAFEFAKENEHFHALSRLNNFEDHMFALSKAQKDKLTKLLKNKEDKWTLNFGNSDFRNLRAPVGGGMGPAALVDYVEGDTLRQETIDALKTLVEKREYIQRDAILPDNVKFSADELQRLKRLSQFKAGVDQLDDVDEELFEEIVDRNDDLNDHIEATRTTFNSYKKPSSEPKGLLESMNPWNYAKETFDSAMSSWKRYKHGNGPWNDFGVNKANLKADKLDPSKPLGKKLDLSEAEVKKLEKKNQKILDRIKKIKADDRFCEKERVESLLDEIDDMEKALKAKLSSKPDKDALKALEKLEKEYEQYQKKFKTRFRNWISGGSNDD